MSTGNNLEEIYSNSIKILKDLIAFKTVSGENNTQLIDYCDNILNSLGAVSFRTYDEEEKRVNLFSTIKAKEESKKKPIILSGHTDVVPVSKGWATDPFDATIKEDKLADLSKTETDHAPTLKVTPKKGEDLDKANDKLSGLLGE